MLKERHYDVALAAHGSWLSWFSSLPRPRQSHEIPSEKTESKGFGDNNSWILCQL